MKFSTLRYYLREAFRGLIRNRLMALASVVTVAACIFLVSATLAILIDLDAVLKHLETSVGVSVYILPDATTDQVNEMYDKLKAIPHVTEIEYIDPDEALSQFGKSIGDTNGDILNDLKENNPLPRSFNLKIDDAKYNDDVVSAMEALPHVEKVTYSQKLTQVLLGINNGIRVFSIFIILLLGVISVVIIMNTIKLAVNNRRIEINIMKYVGATDWFIRWPFVVEGMLIGLIGSLLPVALCWAGYVRVIKGFETMPLFKGWLIFKSSWELFPPIILPIAVFLGVAMGVAGSLTSMRRHLKV